MMFHKDFQFPLEITRPEYKVLEEFLDEGEPIVNPYEIALMYQMPRRVTTRVRN